MAPARRVLLLVVVGMLLPVGALGQVAVIPPRGFEGCQCMSSQEFLAAHNGTTSESLLSAYDPDLVYGSYGIGCKAHDQERDVCKAATLPSTDCDGTVIPRPAGCDGAVPTWCSHQWCYVRVGDGCIVRADVTQIFFQPGSSATQLYSYATCGSLEALSRTDLDLTLQDKVLRVGYRHSSGGWMGAYHPQGNPSGGGMYRDEQWSGPAVQLMQDVAARAGFVINLTDAPQWVYDSAGPTADAADRCIYAVSLGFLDVCGGLFTVTRKRLALTSMVTTSDTPVYLVSKVETESLEEQMLKVFKPFSFQVWIAVTGVLTMTSVFIWLQEFIFNLKPAPRPVKEREYDEWKDPRKACLEPPPPEEESHEEVEVGAFDPNAPWHESMADFVFHGYNSFANWSVLFLPVSTGGRITSLGLGIFILLTLSMYTANLTTILVSGSVAAEVTNIDDAIFQRVPLCVSRELLEDVRKQYPSVQLAKDKDGLEGIDDLANETILWERMDAGFCEGALVFQEDWEEQQALGQYCNTVLVGQPVLTLYRGVALADPFVQNTQLAYSLRYHISDFVSSGEMAKVYRAWRVSSTCPILDVDTSMTFTLHDMLGVLLTQGVFLFLGTGITILMFVLRRFVFEAPTEGTGLDNDKHKPQGPISGGARMGREEIKALVTSRRFNQVLEGTVETKVAAQLKQAVAVALECERKRVAKELPLVDESKGQELQQAHDPARAQLPTSPSQSRSPSPRNVQGRSGGRRKRSPSQDAARSAHSARSARSRESGGRRERDAAGPPGSSPKHPPSQSDSGGARALSPQESWDNSSQRGGHIAKPREERTRRSTKDSVASGDTPTLMAFAAHKRTATAEGMEDPLAPTRRSRRGDQHRGGGNGHDEAAVANPMYPGPAQVEANRPRRPPSHMGRHRPPVLHNDPPAASPPSDEEAGSQSNPIYEVRLRDQSSVSTAPARRDDSANDTSGIDDPYNCFASFAPRSSAPEEPPPPTGPPKSPRQALQDAYPYQR